MSLIATIALLVAVLFMFLSESTDPPGGGIFKDLWVDDRRELVYAFLTLIIFGPVLAVVYLGSIASNQSGSVSSRSQKRKLRTQRLRMLALAALWLAFFIAIFNLAPRQFSAVANVAWRYVIEPKMPEAR